MDLRRHAELFNPEEFDTPITVIGAGATGGWIVYMLAKLGIKDIKVYDFDKVEPHNVPNQIYGVDDVEEYKVDSLYNTIEYETKTQIKVSKDKYTNQRLAGIVILQVDSMAERKRIFRSNIAMQLQVRLMVDSRMGLDIGRIYNVMPTDIDQIRRYERSLYSDEESEVSACGASMTVITSAMNIASTVVRQVINYHNEITLPQEIMLDYINNQAITNNI